MLQKFMEAVQAWITEHVVPVMNKLTSTYWFGVISDAVLYIVPFSMVSAIPSLWNIIRRFVPTLPDLSPLTTFSFGLVACSWRLSFRTTSRLRKIARTVA